MELKGLGLQPLRINLDDDIVKTFIAKEGDYRSRGIDLQILRRNQETDTSGLVVEFYAKPKDGKVYMITAEEKDVSVGKYEIIYPNSILQPGIVKCELRIINGDRIISTKQFNLRVYESMINEEIFEGIDVEPIMAILTEAARNEQDRIDNEEDRQKAESLRLEREEERIAAEIEREKNERKRKEEEQKRLDNEAVRNSSEELRELKEDERITNELARIEGEQERAKAESLRLSEESKRVSNEEVRMANEIEREKQRRIVQGWIDNPSQFDGRSIEYKWDGTKLGIRVEGESEYQYVDLQGPQGPPGSGNVESVNGKEGEVVLSGDDILVSPTWRETIANVLLDMKNNGVSKADIRHIEDAIARHDEEFANYYTKRELDPYLEKLGPELKEYVGHLDNLHDTGIYVALLAADGKPVEAPGVVEVINTTVHFPADPDNTHKVQKFYTLENPEDVYMRTHRGGTWSRWIQERGSYTTISSLVSTIWDENRVHIDGVFNDRIAIHGLTIDVGTFTPYLRFGGTDRNTYDHRIGQYFRIGNMVWFSVSIALSKKGNTTGNATITGLPFRNDSRADVSFVPAKLEYITVSQDGKYVIPSFRIPAGSSTIYFETQANGQKMWPRNDTHFEDRSTINFIGVYYTETY